MTPVDPRWGLDAFLRSYRPHASWRESFAEAYAETMEATDSERRLRGWLGAAMIFGDMRAIVLCLFVCYYGRTLVTPDSQAFLPNIDLCLLDMGLAQPAGSDARTFPIRDLGKPDRFRRDLRTARDWMAAQLGPFGGDVGRAAKFAMRLTAVRLGMLSGPSEPSIAQLEDPELWERVRTS